MNYDWQFTGLYRASGRSGLYDYSRYGIRSPAGTLAVLKETSLSERKGLRATGGARRLQAARYCGIGGRMRLMRLNVPVDWNCNGRVSRGRVRAEINNEKPKQTLRPFDDWANLSYAGGSVGGAAATAAQLTGAAASSRPGPPEATVEQLHKIAQQLEGDFTAPIVRILGTRRVRRPRVARLRVVARDNKRVTDLEVFVDGRVRYLTSLDKPRRTLVLRLRFRRGRHTIVARAVDGASTSSRLGRATVVVR